MVFYSRFSTHKITAHQNAGDGMLESLGKIVLPRFIYGHDQKVFDACLSFRLPEKRYSNAEVPNLWLDVGFTRGARVIEKG